MIKKQDNQQTLFKQGQSLAASFTKEITPDHLVIQGSFMFSVSGYNGTTGTMVLQASNDKSNWQQVYQNDDVTAMSYTLANNSNYTWLLRRRLYKYYRVVYTVGDATTGTVIGDFFGT